MSFLCDLRSVFHQNDNISSLFIARLSFNFNLFFSLFVCSLCRWRRIQQEFVEAEEAVAKLPEFRALDEFAVMYQPFTKNLSVCNHPAFFPHIQCVSIFSTVARLNSRVHRKLHCSLSNTINCNTL